MFRFLKLMVFLAALAWGFNYYQGHKKSEIAQGRNHSDGQYSSLSAQNQAHIIVYGIPCVQTRKYTGMLDQSRIPYLYKDINKTIDSPQWKQDILPRMAIYNINPADLKGPLVDINGKLFVIPDIQMIKQQMNQ